MKNLTDNEKIILKKVLFKWLDSDDLQTWVSAADTLIKLGGISLQETQPEIIE